MSAMNTSNIRPKWAFLAMLAAVPVAGLLCAITEKDISMFYWSLAAVPLCAIVWPITLILMRLIPLACIWIVVRVAQGAYRLFTGKR
jgi:uncharacterized membrane protein